MRNFKHYLIQKLLKWSKVLDIEKALRDKYHEGCAATEKKYAQCASVWVDPTVRVDPHFHVQPKPEPPECTSDAYARAHQQLAQRRVLRKNWLMPPVVRTNTAPLDPDFPEWLIKSGNNEYDIASQSASEAVRSQLINSTIVIDLDDTEEVPGIVKMLNQDRQQRRNAG